MDPQSAEACREIGSGLSAWREAAARGRLSGESSPFLPRFEALYKQRCSHTQAPSQR